MTEREDFAIVKTLYKIPNVWVRFWVLGIIFG